MSEPTTVVVIHWNRPDRLEKSVRALLDQDVPVSIVVVDNGSEPALLAQARAALPRDAVVIENGTNLGFGPAANVGFRWWLEHRGGDWVGLMPHDALPASDCVSTMLAAVADRPRAGLACADYGDGCTPVIDPYLGGILAPATVESGWETAGQPHGTFLMASRGFLTEVGMFDERYFAYSEEADLALRGLAAGWETGLIRGALVHNPDVGHRSAVVEYLQQRNTLLQVRDHFGRWHAFVRLMIGVAGLLGGLARPSRRGPYWDAGARVRAMVDFVRGRFGPPPPAVSRR